MADKRNDDANNIGPPPMNPFHWQTAPNLDLPPLSPQQQHRAAQHSLVGIPQHPYPIHAAAFHMPVAQANDFKPLVDSIKRLEREVVDNREVLSIINKNSIDRLSDLVQNLKNNLERGQDVHVEKTKDEFNKFVSFATLRDEKSQLQHDLISEKINKVMLNQERIERSMEKVEDGLCKLTDMFVSQIQSSNSELRFHRQQHLDLKMLLNASNSANSDDKNTITATELPMEQSTGKAAEQAAEQAVEQPIEQATDHEQKVNAETMSRKERENDRSPTKPDVVKRVERLNFKDKTNARPVPNMRISKPSARFSRLNTNAPSTAKNQSGKTSMLSALIASEDESSNNESGNGSETTNTYDSDNSDDSHDRDDITIANERGTRSKRPLRSASVSDKKPTFNKTNLTFTSRRNGSKRTHDKANTSTSSSSATYTTSDIGNGHAAFSNKKLTTNNREDNSLNSNNRSKSNGQHKDSAENSNTDSGSVIARPKALTAAEEEEFEHQQQEKALAQKVITAKARSERALQRRGTKPPEPFPHKPHKRTDDPVMIVHEGIKDPELIELVKKSQTYPLQLNRLEFSKIFELTLKGDSSTNDLTFKDMMPARRHLKMTCTATYLAMLYSTGELIKELLHRKYTRDEIEYGILEFSKKYMSPKTLSRFLFWFHSNKINLYEDSRDKIVDEIESRKKQRPRTSISS